MSIDTTCFSLLDVNSTNQKLEVLEKKYFDIIRILDMRVNVTEAEDKKTGEEAEILAQQFPELWEVLKQDNKFYRYDDKTKFTQEILEKYPQAFQNYEYIIKLNLGWNGETPYYTSKAKNIDLGNIDKIDLTESELRVIKWNNQDSESFNFFKPKTMFKIYQNARNPDTTPREIAGFLREIFGEDNILALFNGDTPI